MCVFDNPDFADHENVHFCHDKSTGLKAIVAIHNTSLGPAIGGCRMWNYADDTVALTDVLRLSQGMTMKAALANLPFGGGKSVIIGDARTDKKPELFKAFGQFVDSLGGRYYTGEDVGTSPVDMAHAGKCTAYVLGRDEAGSSGDPSPFTAEGVAMGIEVALATHYGSPKIQGRVIAVQGLGAVGMALARKLHARGAQLKIADLDSHKLAIAASEFGADIIDSDAITLEPCDVLAPCAMGATINTDTIGHLQCAIIAGSANNQLATSAMGDALFERGIRYAPDYVINAGGLINIASELQDGGYRVQQARKSLEIIPKRLHQIFDKSQSLGRPEHRVADEMAREIIAGSQQNKLEAA